MIEITKAILLKKCAFRESGYLQTEPGDQTYGRCWVLL